MKIEFVQSVDVEGIVDVSTTDITTALIEALDDAADAVERENTRAQTKARTVLRFVDYVMQCLRGTTVSMIEHVSADNRARIAEALRQEADRWELGASVASEQSL